MQSAPDCKWKTATFIEDQGQDVLRASPCQQKLWHEHQSHAETTGKQKSLHVDKLGFLKLKDMHPSLGASTQSFGKNTGMMIQCWVIAGFQGTLLSQNSLWS